MCWKHIKYTSISDTYMFISYSFILLYVPFILPDNVFELLGGPGLEDLHEPAVPPAPVRLLQAGQEGLGGLKASLHERCQVR